MNNMKSKFVGLEEKMNARIENMRIFQKLTGFQSIPNQYWTLCDFQPPEKGSEIEQYTSYGFLTKNQFVGVDRKKKVIEQNKKWHPEATWHHGEWVDMIRYNPFNPSLIYLDTQMFIDNQQLAKLVCSTMIRCPINVVLVVNVMLNDPYGNSELSRETFINDTLPKYMGVQLNKWNEKIPNYTYNCTGKTEMNTLVFHKIN